MTTLALSSADTATLATDVLVVATAPAGGRKKGAVLVGPAAALKAAPKRKLEESLAALGATGKAGDVVRVPGAGIAAAPVVVAVGLGAGPWTDEALRRAAGNAARAARRHAPRGRSRCPSTTRRRARRRRPGRAARRLRLRRLPRRQQGRAQTSPVDRITLHVADAKDARHRSPPSPAPRPSPAPSTSPATSSTPRPTTCAPADFAAGRDRRGRGLARRRRDPRRGRAAEGGLRRHPRRRQGLGQPAAARAPAPTAPRARPRTSPSSARASRSTPAASRSSPRPTCTR